MKISVTAHHITHGIRCDAADCMLAMAFLDAGCIDLMVGPDVDFYDAGNCLVASLPLPPSARQAMIKWEDHLPVTPFEFEMPIPAAALHDPGSARGPRAGDDGSSSRTSLPSLQQHLQPA